MEQTTLEWPPHITVACIIEQDGKFLLIEEYSAGKPVFNQPAGHLEPDETLSEAAVRETLEESGWHVEITAFLGISKYVAQHKGAIYFRHSFIGKALSQVPNAVLDDGIIRAVWMDIDEIRANADRMRSPLVIKNIEQYLNGEVYPLSMVDDFS